MEITNEQKLFQEVVTKAWEDAAFKQELIANPLEAIEKLTGQRLEMPEGKTVVVRDQTDQSTVYINIPANPNMDDVELSEAQLETVSGGVASTILPWEDIWFPFPPKGCFPTEHLPG